MRRKLASIPAMAAAIALVSAACGGGDGSFDAATSTTLFVADTSTTTTAPEPELVVASEGDSGPVARAVQFMLICNGYTRTVVEGRDEELIADGMYGKITTSVVDRVTRDLGPPARFGSTVPTCASSTCARHASVSIGAPLSSICPNATWACPATARW